MNWFGWIIVVGALYKQRNMFQENCPVLFEKKIITNAYKKEIEQMHFVVFL